MPIHLHLLNLLKNSVSIPVAALGTGSDDDCPKKDV